MRLDVAAFEDLVEGRVHPVRVGGREIALVRWRGEVHAIKNICPHQTQPFTSGTVRPHFTGLPGEPGTMDVDFSDPDIACPVHTWKFSLRTGKCRVDAALRVRRYDAEVENGRVIVDLSSPARRSLMASGSA